MKRFARSLAILATCAAFQAQAADNPGDNPPPGLLAKIQIATQAHQDALKAAQDSQAAGREFKDMTKFARENAPAPDGGNGGVSAKKVGGLDVSKSGHGPRSPGAIGKAIGGRASDGERD